VISVFVKPLFSLISESSSGVQVLESQPYIYMKGIDTQANSLSTMVSEISPVMMSSDVCPLGYILVLDQSLSVSNQSAVLGGCSQCQPGTYSVHPLAGLNALRPTCFNCPTGGSCKGGFRVEFLLGIWKIMGGMYRLVSCPAGNQLVNSVNGVFSHDIQSCLACALNTYILESNNSNMKCQVCPVGAVCNGSDLAGLIKGSVWVKNMDAGLYTLQSCPGGYEIQASTQEGQECQFCPSSYYCPGGSNPKRLCPGNAFSTPGANSSAACFSAVMVAVSVTLPLMRNEFAAEVAHFQSALAAAAGVASDYVVITGVSSTRRRSTGASIQARLLCSIERTVCSSSLQNINSVHLLIRH
jgi:hypothetical protein